ncbi:uncharacterized protein LOC131662588 isoform X2 [Vicia villosa]|uniref:uncharacterized protein LOC131662588 isoform X2 n=1 Tax=Vicia villosa TaxID=3911 RepID=UPI00273BB749|nr:uncharacterized protein LOC131662588 isoform X2 [Vicia villosa]
MKSFLFVFRNQEAKSISLGRNLSCSCSEVTNQNQFISELKLFFVTHACCLQRWFWLLQIWLEKRGAFIGANSYLFGKSVWINWSPPIYKVRRMT